MAEVQKDQRLIDFGVRVRRARTEAGLTQAAVREQLAVRGVPVPATAVAKIEAGDRPTSVIEVAALADVLRVSVARLIEGDTGRPEPFVDKIFAWRLEATVKSRDALVTCAHDYRVARRELQRAADEFLAFLNSRMGYPPERVSAEGLRSDASLQEEMEEVINLLSTLPPDPEDVVRKSAPDLG